MNLDQIDSLIKSGIGDIERLKHIKQSLEEGRIVYNSDKAYVEKLVLQHDSSNIKNSDSSQKTLDEVEPSNESDDESTKSDVAYCGKCGQKVAISNNFCQKCGAKTNQNNSDSSGYNQQNSQPNVSSRLQRPPEWKSVSITTILSVIIGLFGIQGVGHFYLGKIGRGIGILIAPLVLLIIGMAGLMSLTAVSVYSNAPEGVIIGYVIFGIGSIVFYIFMFFWQIFDARKLCRYYNDYLEKNNRAPW